MHRFPLLLAASAGFIPVVAVAATTPSLDQVVASLRGTTTMIAQFEQIDRLGHSLTGTLTLKRPGKARFQYGPNVPMLMVADGKSLYYIDYKVRQVQRWPIGAAPLRVILDPQGDPSRVAKIVPSPYPGAIAVEARDPRHPEYGTVTLGFTPTPSAPGGYELNGWTVLDAQNNRSVVRLTGQRYNVPVPDSTFNWVDPRRAGPR